MLALTFIQMIPKIIAVESCHEVTNLEKTDLVLSTMEFRVL